MKKRYRKTIIVFLLGVFIYSLSMPCGFAVFISQKSIHELEEQKKTEELPEVITRPKIRYTAGDLRDPFQSYIKETEKDQIQTQVTAGELAPSLTVQGLVWGSEIPQAIINNKVVRPGDTIDGARILEITKEGIIVFYNNRQYNLFAPGVVYQQGQEKATKEGGTNEEYN